MPKKPPAESLPKGSVQPHGGQHTLRIRLGGVQTRIKLGALDAMTRARARAKADAWIERMEREGYSPEAPPPLPSAATVKGHFEAWISGELYKRHGDVNGLKAKASADTDAWRAGKWVYPEIGSKPVVDVTEQDIEQLLARIPEAQAGTRIKVFALLSRGFDLAVRPARLRADSPVTKYQRPSRPAKKLFAYLFPAELLALLCCKKIPLGRRVFYALAVYTGLRKSSLYALRWLAVGLETRTLLSRVSKNGVPQYFEIPPGLVWILRAWYAHCGKPEQSTPVVRQLKIERGKGGEAKALREDLREAGVTREVLFEKPKPDPKAKASKASKGAAEPDNVEPLRFHDMRATFVTWAKRAGKGEGWIADRTGHLTPEMVDRYSRAARTLADLGIDPFPELEGTIPELAQLLTPATPAALGGDGSSGKEGSEEPSGEPAGGVGSCAQEVCPRGVSPSQTERSTLEITEKSAVLPGLDVDSGSSGVTLVGVQVPRFALAGIIEESAGQPVPSKGAAETLGTRLGTGPAPGDHRAALAGALAEGVARALAAGDGKAARLALQALQGLVGDVGEGGAPVVDLAEERRRRS